LKKSEKEFIKKYIHEDLDEINKEWTEEQNKNINNYILNFYDQAKQLPIFRNANFNDNSEKNIIDKIGSFFFEKKENKKLFMCNSTYSEFENFINSNLDDIFIKKLFIKNLIVETLKKIEKDVKNKEKEFKNNDEYKKYLNENIGKYYDSLIIPNIYFIRLLILVSIEGGDYIKFNHKLDIKKYYKNFINVSLCVLTLGIHFFYSMLNTEKSIQKDFEKNFTKNEIEEINMKNLFYKNKTKKIIKSNIDTNDFFILLFLLYLEESIGYMNSVNIQKIIK
jgi:hypothetical protein